MTIYLYDFLFRDNMVSGVEGHECIGRLEALPRSACLVLRITLTIYTLHILTNHNEDASHTH